MIEISAKKPSILFRNNHFNTIWSSKIRRVKSSNYTRVRITTPDFDFIDLDTIIKDNSTVTVIIHGLEGSSESTSIKSMVNVLESNNYDIIVVNLRGCSGEHNLVENLYNSGRTEDVETVINYIKKEYDYTLINLIGFSLGGNLVLKYGGEPNCQVDKIVGISVPCDLKASCLEIEKGFNNIYNQRFVKSLKFKILHKIKEFPNFGITKKQLNQIKTVYQFDDLYTAPFHGYTNAEDYYEKCSSKNFISKIKVPTLLINALDDPFLTPSCFPFEQAKNNINFHLITPKHGGHVGFMNNTGDSVLWHEKSIINFLK